jgi:predicted Fe-Mo cluster-binding NifX family protein
MKTVITSTGDDVSSSFDVRFGRAKWFCVYDHTSGETKFIKNEYCESNSGAGTKAAELMADLEINKIISGDFGPKAKSLLERLNIRMIVPDDSGKTVQELIDNLE